MKKFLIEFPVTDVYGYQVFAVHAETAEEADKKFLAGEGDIVETELEVTSLSKCDRTIREAEEGE